MFWVFLCCLLLPLALSEEEKFITRPDDPLLLVQVIIRNAEETPVHNPSSPEAGRHFFRGVGNLINAGIENAYRQGEAFRRRYVDSSTGFLDRRFLPNQIYIRSSPKTSALMSAGSFGSALFDKTPSGRIVPLPINSESPENDYLLLPHLNCAPDWDIVEAAYDLKEERNTHKGDAELWHKISAPLKQKCLKFSSADIKAAVALVNDPHSGLTAQLRECAKTEGKRIVYKMDTVAAGVDAIADSEDRTTTIVGPFLHNLVQNIVDKSTCNNCTTPRMRIYYTDNVMLIALAKTLGVLDIFNREPPEYSSALVLELRNAAMGPYIKLLLKNGPDADFKGLRVFGLESARVGTLISETEKWHLEYPVVCSGMVATSALPIIAMLVYAFLYE